jgi:hypothetical protein
MPEKKSSATVTVAESSSDPRQPRRFEKKKNMSLSSAKLPTAESFWSASAA